MGRVTTPSEEIPNNGIPVQQTGTPNQQTGVPVSQFAPPNYHQANVNLSVGRPWSTGLFDCHEDQTNGIVSVYTLIQVLDTKLVDSLIFKTLCSRYDNSLTLCDIRTNSRSDG